MPVPRCARVYGVAQKGRLFSSNYNTFSFEPLEKEGDSITYQIVLNDEDDNDLNSIVFLNSKAEPPLEFCREETFYADNLMENETSHSRIVEMVISAARSIGCVYCADSWPDEIIEATRGRKLLALEALQIFNCDSASTYLAHRFAQYGVAHQIIHGLVPSDGKFLTSVGHAEVEYQTEIGRFRVSSSDITRPGDRVPKSVAESQVRDLVRRIPGLSDQELFEAIASFRNSLPVCKDDTEQIDRERRAMGLGARSFERTRKDRVTVDEYVLSLILLAERIKEIEESKFSTRQLKEFFSLVHRVAYQERKVDSSEVAEVLGTFFKGKVPEEILELTGYSSEVYLKHKLKERVLNTLSIVLKADEVATTQEVVRFIEPNFPDRSNGRSELDGFVVFDVEALLLLGARNLTYLPPHQRAKICVALLRGSRRNFYFSGYFEPDYIDRFTNELHALAMGIHDDKTDPSYFDFGTQSKYESLVSALVLPQLETNN